MSATIVVFDEYAHMGDEEYEWESDDARLARLLNSLLDENGPSGADPHPAGTAAFEMVERFGGEVIHSDPPPRKAGRIY